MTLYKFAIIPKTCDKCRRIFWLERYETFYREVGIEHYDLKCVKCFRCRRNEHER